MVRIELTVSGILPIKRIVPMKDGVSIIRKVDDIGRKRGGCLFTS